MTDKSKDDRRKIHEAIKDGFGKEVYSNTVDRGSKKFITIFKTRKGGKLLYINIFVFVICEMLRGIQNRMLFSKFLCVTMGYAAVTVMIKIC